MVLGAAPASVRIVKLINKNYITVNYGKEEYYINQYLYKFLGSYTQRESA